MSVIWIAAISCLFFASNDILLRLIYVCAKRTPFANSLNFYVVAHTAGSLQSNSPSVGTGDVNRNERFDDVFFNLIDCT